MVERGSMSMNERPGGVAPPSPPPTGSVAVAVGGVVVCDVMCDLARTGSSNEERGRDTDQFFNE